MLRSIKDLEGWAVGATDGTIGHVKDFYFDDRAWIVRYLVVDAGGWLSSRKVLISPIAIGHPWQEKILPASLTKDQVRKSPDIDTERPVSRQHEMQYSSYYGYPYYWGGAGYWGGGMYANLLLPGYGACGSPQATRMAEQNAYAKAESEQHQHDDPHLRSCQAVMKYHIHATDGDIGHVEGMLVDDATWAIRYLIVNTSNWWVGHQVLVSPQWIESVSWFDSKVSVDLTRQSVKDAPAYDLATVPDRLQEAGIYEHYGRTGYWAEDARPETRRPATSAARSSRFIRKTRTTRDTPITPAPTIRSTKSRATRRITSRC